MDAVSVSQTTQLLEPIEKVLTTKTRILRELPNVKAKAMRVLRGNHTLEADAWWRSHENVPDLDQYIADEWWEITKIDNETVPIETHWLAIQHHNERDQATVDLDPPIGMLAAPGYDPLSETVTTTTERHLRDNPGLKAKILRTLKGTHKLVIIGSMKFTKADPKYGVQVGDEWLLVESVDGEPYLGAPWWLARVQNGKVLTEYDGKAPPPPPLQRRRSHKVVSGDNLDNIAKTYNTSKAKLVEANKQRYPQIAKGSVKDGWVLTIV